MVVALGAALPAGGDDLARGALDALVAAVAAMRARLGDRAPGRWPALSVITGGMALATTTSPLFSPVAAAGWMPSTT